MFDIIAKTKNMPRETWLALRRRGLGGSDAGAVCGVNPYASALSVYRDKTEKGAEEEEDSESMRLGRDLEEYVAKRFTEASGLKARRANVMYRSVEHPFMLADIDRVVIGEDAGLECKTASPYSADKWKDGNVPLHYALQCLHYMVVTGKRTWYIAALVLGKEFLYRKIDYNDELARELIRIEKEFWEGNVLKRTMPPPDGSPAYDSVLEKYFHTAKKESAIELKGFDEKLEKRAEIVAEIEALTAEKKRIEQEVKLFMGDSELATGGNYRVTWGNVRSMRLDTKKLKEEQPEIYGRYARESTGRRFEIRAA